MNLCSFIFYLFHVIPLFSKFQHIQTVSYMLPLTFRYNGQRFSDNFYVINCSLPKPVILGLPFFQKHPTILTTILSPVSESNHSIMIVNSRQMKNELKDPTVESYLLWLSDVDKPISQDLSIDTFQKFADVVVDSIPAKHATQPTYTPTTKHYIKLKEGVQPVAKRAYRMSPSDQQELNT